MWISTMDRGDSSVRPIATTQGWVSREQVPQENSMNIESIGIIHSPITSPKNAPIQPGGADGLEGRVEIYTRYREGLRDLAGFSHIYLLYQFHLAPRTELTVIPFMDVVKRGVFATRSPLRPNHIGISIVRLMEVRECSLFVADIDIVDQTPLLDIKPYIHAFDHIDKSDSGWMKADNDEIAAKRSDDRFV